MSEKIIEVKDIRNLHIFNCDKCGKKIMESIEHDDGYYELPDWLYESIFVRGNEKRYCYKTGFLCQPCMKKTIDVLIEKLLSIGFKEEK